MKKILLLAFLVVSATLYSQEFEDFDKSFIDSLPEDVAEDLRKRTEEKNKTEEINYRRPSSYLDKKDENSILNDDEEEIASKELERFGKKIFNLMQSTFMPINEPNFDSTYILDTGDVIEVQLIGQESSTSSLLIKRDGSVNIDVIGKLFLSGLSLENATNLIKSKISEAFVGVEAYITLANVRDIQVIIAGDAYNPGSYILNGNSNVFHALSVAGGPSEIGSYRSIKLIRNNKIIETIDLYDIFINGLNASNNRLRSGDLIYIDQYVNLISVSGGVKRPAIYELIENEPLSKAILYANNINAYADLSEIYLYRILDGEIKNIKIVNLKQFDEIIANDRDSIIIREHSFRNVEILGAVKNPGVYTLSAGQGIYDIVSRAGGYTDLAYPYGGILENKEVKEKNEIAMERLYSEAMTQLMELISNSGSKIDINTMKLLTEQIRETPISGRVSAEFDLEILLEDKNKDIPLQDEDKIFIPEDNKQVYVFGEVLNTGTIMFSPGKDINYYINKMGGYTDLADKKAIFVLLPNGYSVRNTRKNLFMNAPKDYINIHSGSIIFVPKKIENKLLRQSALQTYATIISNLGVSLASLSVIKN